MNATTLQVKDNALVVNGELTRHSITRVFEKSAKPLRSQAFTKVDLSDVSRIDTAGLAWLLSLVETANKTQITLTFSPVSADLMKLAKLTGVASFLQA